jgi:serine/threonine protein kinase
LNDFDVTFSSKRREMLELTVSDLDLSTVVALQARTTVYVMSHASGRICVKRSLPEIVRLTEHEFAVLQHLDGVAGIPRAFGAVFCESSLIAESGTNKSESDVLPGTSFLLTTFFKAAPLNKLFYVSPRFPLATAATIFLHVAQIMSEVHARGVVHCDLKLSNILLNASEEHDEAQHTSVPVVVVDFASAITVSNGVKLPPNESCCTMHIRAPETFLSEYPTGLDTDLIFSCDFWSFGVCLFEVVVGVPPFGSFGVKSCDVHDISSALCWPREFLSPTSEHQSFVALTLELLQKDPRKRLRSWSGVAGHCFFQLCQATVPELYLEEAEMQTLGL